MSSTGEKKDLIPMLDDDAPTLNDKQGGLFSFERVEPMFGRGRRDWSVDVLRCLSCFIVCAGHSSSVAWFYPEITGIETHPFIDQVYRMPLASPTVLFVMVSGIFFLSPERNVRVSKVWKKNIMKMTFAYIFWCLIYAIYRLYTMDPPVEKITSGVLAHEWLIQAFHLWYIPMIIWLYMLCPLIRPLTATYDAKLFKYTVILFVSALVLWTIFTWPWEMEVMESKIPHYMIDYIKPIINKTPMTHFAQYPFWMILGWLAYTYRPNKRLRLLIYALGIAAIIIGIPGSIHLYAISEDPGCLALTSKFSIFVFFKNIAIFYFVLTVFREHKFSRLGTVILRKWSDCTLIIYLMHALLLFILFDHGFLYNQGVSPWICVWVYAFTAYFFAGVAGIAFHFIWDPIKKRYFTPKTA